VCTPVAAEGMGLEPGVNVLVGADAGELAAHVIDLLRDDARWQRLSDAGRAYARDTTSRASAHRRIREVLGLEPVPGPGTALRE
jgi:glycosyltransferase involved in cell wall biosynthesis